MNEKFSFDLNISRLIDLGHNTKNIEAVTINRLSVLIARMINYQEECSLDCGLNDLINGTTENQAYETYIWNLQFDILEYIANAMACMFAYATTLNKEPENSSMILNNINHLKHKLEKAMEEGFS